MSSPPVELGPAEVPERSSPSTSVDPLDPSLIIASSIFLKNLVIAIGGGIERRIRLHDDFDADDGRIQDKRLVAVGIEQEN